MKAKEHSLPLNFVFWVLGVLQHSVLNSAFALNGAELAVMSRDKFCDLIALNPKALV